MNQLLLKDEMVPILWLTLLVRALGVNTCQYVIFWAQARPTSTRKVDFYIRTFNKFHFLHKMAPKSDSVFRGET